VSDAALEAERLIKLRRLVRPGAAVAGVAGIICVIVALDVVWLVRFRRGYVTEWDESGYLQFALSNFDALHDQGVWTFLKTVGGRGTFGPLLPLVTALAYPIVGRSIFGSLLVLPLFFAGLVSAAFALARQLVSDRWAVVAALTVAAIPAVTDYTRLFHFALPATACMTAALWALLRSDGLRRVGWAVAFGVFVALTLLSRTMTVAYLPGVTAAALVLLVASERDLRVRVRNLAVAAAATALVAGPWYLRNAPSVYDSLVGSGYGEGATPFGSHYPLASWGYWTKEFRLDITYLGLPLVGALLLALVVGLAWRARPTHPRSLRAAGLLALALVVMEGYLVLTTSRNEGTAFALPWFPALVVLAVTAAASVPARSVRAVLATVLVAVSVAAVGSKSGWLPTLAKIRTVTVPGLGSVPITDGRGIIQREIEGDGYGIGPVTQPLPAMHRRWLPVARDVVDWSLRRAVRRGGPLDLTLGLDDRIFGNSRLTLAAQLWFHRFLLVRYLHAARGGDTVVGYRHQLVSPEVVNALVTGAPPPSGSAITRWKVEAAARSLGFVRAKPFALPDGRRIWVWWRDRS
jgi:4-amino-4-deoxy-L-arabinose transferase-like glycosyltransferase